MKTFKEFLDENYKSDLMPAISADEVSRQLRSVKTLFDFNAFLGSKVYKRPGESIADFYRDIDGLYVDYGRFFSVYVYDIDYLEMLGVDIKLFKKWHSATVDKWNKDTKRAENNADLRVGPKPVLKIDSKTVTVQLYGTIIEPMNPDYYHNTQRPD